MKYKWFLLLVLFCKIPAPALAQCQLIFDGSPCLGDTIYFFGAPNGTNHKFDFNVEGTKTGVYSTSYVFKTAGAKTVTYTSTVNGSACTSSVNLVIHAKPVVVFSLRSPTTQCFENNLFCFRDSSYSAQGTYLVDEEITSNDGQVFQFKNPKTPKDFCFSVKDERSIISELYIKLEDNNGCVFYDTLEKIGTVREKIGARFTRTSPKNPDCDSTAVTLNNLSRISTNNVKTVRWDFGDGKQSNAWGPTLKHTFKSVGTFATQLL
ncbi:MAG: PKD domain-containing protein, partial [Bacteroidia bacterium]|nr:PKD domain-containing protein [Bacteroidia bacterium]